MERMQSMSPEEREQFLARMRERGIDPQSLGAGPSPQASGPGAARQGGRQAPAGTRTPAPAAGSAQTFDSLFGPLPPTESSGRVWLFVNGQLKSVRVRLGISDGNYTELLSGELQPGTEVVSTVTLPTQSSTSAAGRSPLMGPSRGGPPMGGQPGRPQGGR